MALKEAAENNQGDLDDGDSAVAPASTKNAASKQPSSLKIAPLQGKPSVNSAWNANKAQQLKQQILDERE